MAWIKTQDGRLFNAGEFILTSAGGGGGTCKPEIRSGGTVCGTYATPAIAEQVKGDIERWIMLGADGIFTMPDKDHGITLEAKMMGRTRSNCGAGFKSYMAADPNNPKGVPIFPMRDILKNILPHPLCAQCHLSGVDDDVRPIKTICIEKGGTLDVRGYVQIVSWTILEDGSSVVRCR